MVTRTRPLFGQNLRQGGSYSGVIVQKTKKKFCSKFPTQKSKILTKITILLQKKKSENFYVKFQTFSFHYRPILCKICFYAPFFSNFFDLFRFTWQFGHSVDRAPNISVHCQHRFSFLSEKKMKVIEIKQKHTIFWFCLFLGSVFCLYCLKVTENGDFYAQIVLGGFLTHGDRKSVKNSSEIIILEKIGLFCHNFCHNRP